LPRILETNVYIQFLLTFIVILLLKWETISEPPFWDAAMGLFPAAFTLAGNGFDLIGLLQMPAYAAGGPNTHSTSLVTLLTGVVLALFGGGSKGFVILHLLHFGVAAVAIVTLFRFARPVFGPIATGLLCLSVLLYPVFSVQVGSMYMEIPLFLCAVSALLAWVHGRFWLAVMWSTLAIAVKEPGIIVPATLLLAAMLENRNLTTRIKRMFLIAIPPAIWVGLTFILGMIAKSSGADQPSVIESFRAVFGGFAHFLHYLNRFLFNVPDLLVFIVVFLVAAAALSRDIVEALRQEPSDPLSRETDQQARQVLGLSGILISCFLLLFFVVLPVAVHFTIVLPRYYVVILPFLLLWAGYAVQRLVGERCRSPAIACFALLAVIFGLNSDGRFYPSDIDTEGPGNDPPLIERSNSVFRFNSIQREAMEYLETLPEGIPVYYGHYEHYLFSYPELGYASAPFSDGHSLSLETLDDSQGRIKFPPCAYFLYNYPWLGGAYILKLLRYVDSREDLSSEVVRVFTSGRYRITLIRVWSADADCPANARGD